VRYFADAALRIASCASSIPIRTVVSSFDSAPPPATAIADRGGRRVVGRVCDEDAVELAEGEPEADEFAPERLDRLGRGRAAVLWIAHQRPDGIGRVAEPAEVLRHGRRPPSVMIVAPIVLDPGAFAQDLPRYPR